MECDVFDADLLQQYRAKKQENKPLSDGKATIFLLNNTLLAALLSKLVAEVEYDKDKDEEEQDENQVTHFFLFIFS